MYGSLADPEDFRTIFLNEDYENIYYCTSIDFQKLISLEQFVELAATFNGGVNYYQIEFNLPFQDMTHYIWVDDQKEKAISVFFDEKKRIQRLYLKPFVTYEQSDNRFTVNLYTMPVKGEWFVFWGGQMNSLIVIIHTKVSVMLMTSSKCRMVCLTEIHKLGIITSMRLGKI
ncbi:hypothetical protein OR571_15560 [Psychrobacillus sp. NEAU-3TGS]|uniref:hypothetical protein n=1 Tax=Psychrobacillus sp. NEAU-3TGS TaxID=2995412 RepID=UPI00249763BD|nr:hypothetical protein [Psychrobacillus sp. NEAU-3TGS]MDI2588492.1 hypothetical protein [Psychrobacillus sp. NEAU-3TGS]